MSGENGTMVAETVGGDTEYITMDVRLRLFPKGTLITGHTRNSHN